VDHSYPQALWTAFSRMNSLRNSFSQVLSLSLSDSCSLYVEPCSQTQINGRNTSTGAFNSRPWKTGSVFKTSVHLYPPDLRSESVQPRERERESTARGGRRRDTVFKLTTGGSNITCTKCVMS